jgi:pyruvate dehydrogenase E2 component (dihydrolipoamide acetyltransferase)
MPQGGVSSQGGANLPATAPGTCSGAFSGLANVLETYLMLEPLAIDALGESGALVVLLNGTPVVPEHLTPLAQRLAVRYRSWNVHLPGYGRSRARLPYDLEESHRLVEETLAAKGAGPVHLVGFSGGAYRALALAARGRLDVRSISLLGGFRGFTPEQRPAYREYARLLREGVDLSPALPGLMLSAAAQTRAGWVEHVKTWAKAASDEALAGELEALAESPVVDVTRIRAPILARAGELDAALPIAASREIAEFAPHVTLQIVPSVGHTLLLEDFDATAAAIEAHLSAAERAS